MKYLHGLHLVAHGLAWLALGDFEVGRGFSVTQAEPEQRSEASFVVTAEKLPAAESDLRLPSAYEKAFRLSERAEDRRPFVVWVGSWDQKVTEALPNLYHVRVGSFQGQPEGSVIVSAWRNGRLTWLETFREGTRLSPTVNAINRVLGHRGASLSRPLQSFSSGNRSGNC